MNKKTKAMTRFETVEKGLQIGVTFFAGKKLGKVKFLSNSELKTLWSLDENEEIISDNGWRGSVGELLDMFSKLKQLSQSEMEERGLGDRLESGLHLRNAISESGKLIIIR
jgi:hypothetical protein